MPQDSSKVIIRDGHLTGCSACWLTKKCGPNNKYGQGKIETIYIIMNDSMQTRIDYSNYKNWIYNSDGDVGIYRITLNNTDFENINK